MAILPAKHRSLEGRTTWIWGSHRSGSTWLLRQLCHPLSPNPRQPQGFTAPSGRMRHDVIPVDDLFLANHIAPSLGDPVELDSGELIPGTLNNLLGEKTSYFFSDAYEESWRPAARRFALDRIQAVIDRARSEGTRLVRSPEVVLKEVSGTHAADLVMGMIPRARMLFLIRDGRDVVDSVMHAYQPGGFLARTQGYSFAGPEEREQGVRWAAQSWAVNVDVMRRSILSHPDHLSRTVRYEDLRSDPAGQLRELFDWIGLERPDGLVEGIVEAHSFESIPEDRKGSTEHKRTGTSGGWRQNLSPSEQETVAEIMGSRLAELGYSDS